MALPSYLDNFCKELFLMNVLCVTAKVVKCFCDEDSCSFFLRKLDLVFALSKYKKNERMQEGRLFLLLGSTAVREYCYSIRNINVGTWPR